MTVAYPGEPEHMEYLEYVEKVSNGEEAGPQLTKAEWKKRRDQSNQQAAAPQKNAEVTSVLTAKES